MLLSLCGVSACDRALKATTDYVAHKSGQPDHVYFGETARALYRAQPHVWGVAEHSSDMEGSERNLLIDTAHMTVIGTTHATAWVATIDVLNGTTINSFGQLVDFSCDLPNRDRYANRQAFTIPGGLHADSVVAVTTWDAPVEQQITDHSGDMAFFQRMVCDLTWQRRGSPADLQTTPPD
jgi:hypothetical protein